MVAAENKKIEGILSAEDLNDCQCPKDDQTFDLYKEYIKDIDETVEAMRESCHNIINGEGSHYNAQSVYGNLKALETTFAQMAEIALQCDEAREIAEPIIQKSEEFPVVNMVEVAGSNFLNSMYENHVQYYYDLRAKHCELWLELTDYQNINS